MEIINSTFCGDTKIYHKWGKIRWAKLLRFSWFSGVPQKFFHEYKCLSLIVLNNERTYSQGKVKVFP